MNLPLVRMSDGTFSHVSALFFFSPFQDVSHHMRLTTNDLFHLEDKVDIVASCNILPDIDINIPAN